MCSSKSSGWGRGTAGHAAILPNGQATNLRRARRSRRRRYISAGDCAGTTEPVRRAGTTREHWEADVLLRDGRTAHLRPIRPEDAERLVEFYGGVSDQSKYFRFFAPMPQLSDRDVQRFTNVDYHDRVAFVMTVAGRRSSRSAGTT